MKQNKLVVFSLLALVLSSLLSCSAPATDPSPPDDAVLDVKGPAFVLFFTEN